MIQDDWKDSVNFEHATHFFECDLAFIMIFKIKKFIMNPVNRGYTPIDLEILGLEKQSMELDPKETKKI